MPFSLGLNTLSQLCRFRKPQLRKFSPVPSQVHKEKCICVRLFSMLAVCSVDGVSGVIWLSVCSPLPLLLSKLPSKLIQVFKHFWKWILSERAKHYPLREAAKSAPGRGSQLGEGRRAGHGALGGVGMAGCLCAGARSVRAAGSC